MATLLFLGASVSQLPAIRHAREAGHRIVAVDADPNAIAFPLVDVAQCVDFTDVERVANVGLEFGAEGVLAICSDRAVLPAAAVAEQLSLPGIGVEVARAMTDKPVMRSRLAAAGVPQPEHLVLERADVAAARSIRLPAVLKPADSGGQRGLYMIETPDDLERRLPETLAFSRTGRAMLEEYVDGVELNGLMVVRDGKPTLLTLSDRLRPGGVAFGVGWIHSFPSSLPDSALAEARDVAFAAVSALGLRDGIAFPQLIVDEAGNARLVEIAARIGAGQMADLVLFATGVELFEVAIAQALGVPVPDAVVTPRYRRPIAIRFLTAAPGVLPLGTVDEIEGLESVRESPGVLAAGLYFESGDTIGPLQVDADRRGYVVATGETPQEALDLADRAATKLVVHTTQDARSSERGSLTVRFAPRLVPLGAVCLLLFLAAYAFAVTENAGLQRALVTGTRVDKVFSPRCRCAHDLAHLTFRLAHKSVVTVQMINTAGRPVTTFVRHRLLPGGWKHFVWNGRNRRGQVLPDGTYRPQVVFAVPNRTIRLPDAIDLAGSGSVTRELG